MLQNKKEFHRTGKPALLTVHITINALNLESVSTSISKLES